VDKNSRRLMNWAPLIIYWGIITYFSSIPYLRLPFPSFVGMDKILHLLEYSLLGVLFSRAWLRSWPTTIRTTAGMLVLTGLFAFLVGMADEWHQTRVIGRTPSAWDALADISGCLLGACLYKKWLERESHD
jgi:VanZ family protein